MLKFSVVIKVCVSVNVQCCYKAASVCYETVMNELNHMIYHISSGFCANACISNYLNV